MGTQTGDVHGLHNGHNGLEGNGRYVRLMAGDGRELDYRRKVGFAFPLKDIEEKELPFF